MRAIHPERRIRIFSCVVLALVLSLSLYLRLADLDRYLTADEGSWEDRSRAFHLALRSHDLVATYQSKHPGVITMWLGTAADVIVSHQATSAAADESEPAGVSPLTLWARRLVALTTWLGILALYPLLRTILDPPAALAAVALVALDPFFLGHSRVHHLDALMTTFVMLSGVALLAYRRSGRAALLVLSGVCGGLAAIAKVPGVFLAPWAALALWVMPGPQKVAGRQDSGLWRWLRPLLLWGGAALLAAVLAWPALWTAPAAVLREMWAGLVKEAGQAHATGAYFWGAARDDPGAGYYPVVWIFRTTPWVVLGLAGLAARRRSEGWRPLLALGLLALFFGMGVTFSPKKFDRYLLPVFPLLDILAGVGLVALWHRLIGRSLPNRWGAAVGALALLVVVASQWALIWPARPYYTSYYDPFVGGARTASWFLQTGWGEGLDQAAAYLNSLPDADDQVIAAQWPKLVEPFALGTVKRISQVSPWEPDYVVLASSQVQREIDAEAVTHYYYGSGQPVFTASSDGVPYVWVYANDYGNADLETLITSIVAQVQPQDTAILLTSTPAFARHYQGRFTLITLDASSRSDYLATALQEQAADRRRLWLLDYPSADPEIKAALTTLLAGWGTPGPALVAGELTATPYDALEEATTFLGEPGTAVNYVFAGRLLLAGYTLSGAALGPGAEVDLRLFWQDEAPGEAAWKVFVHVVGPDGTIYGQSDAVPQGYERPTNSWKPGETLVDDYHVEISQDAPASGLSLRVGMYDGESLQRLAVVDADGETQAEGEVTFQDNGRPAGP